MESLRNLHGLLLLTQAPGCRQRQAVQEQQSLDCALRVYASPFQERSDAPHCIDTCPLHAGVPSVSQEVAMGKEISFFGWCDPNGWA